MFQALHGASTPANLNPYIKTLIKNQAILEPSSLAVHQPVDVLVAAAGSCICDTFDRLSAADLDSQLRVNVLGALYPCQQVVLSLDYIYTLKVVVVCSSAVQACYRRK